MNRPDLKIFNEDVLTKDQKAELITVMLERLEKFSAMLSLKGGFDLASIKKSQNLIRNWIRTSFKSGAYSMKLDYENFHAWFLEMLGFEFRAIGLSHFYLCIQDGLAYDAYVNKGYDPVIVYETGCKKHDDKFS